MMGKKVKLQIYRSRPETPHSFHFDTFTISVNHTTSVLNVLEHIKLNIDKTLLYRHSCHHGSCGTCACIINGVERLACRTSVFELESETVRIEPLKKFEAIGDIAVYPEKLFTHIDRAWTYLRVSEWNSQAVAPDEIESFVRFESCIECGACVSACPVTNNFQGPAALSFLNRELQNHPDKEKRILKIADRSNGIWKCERALACSKVCPSGVFPARHIMELRNRAQKNTH
jgi:succinate dehydrogenase / fumarate reductase iron-sulfur subunit